jgi:hypothetical protein
MTNLKRIGAGMKLLKAMLAQSETRVKHLIKSQPDKLAETKKDLNRGKNEQ